MKTASGGNCGRPAVFPWTIGTAAVTEAENRLWLTERETLCNQQRDNVPLDISIDMEKARWAKKNWSSQSMWRRGVISDTIFEFRIRTRTSWLTLIWEAKENLKFGLARFRKVPHQTHKRKWKNSRSNLQFQSREPSPTWLTFSLHSSYPSQHRASSRGSAIQIPICVMTTNDD